jgi:hypothetical protein
MRPDDDTQVTFSCSGRQGALLYLPFPAEREDTVAHGDFAKWIVKNIYNCMRLAEERGLGANRMEDIILVTGRHLAKSWVRAVFSESREGAHVSFGVRESGDSVVHLEERNVSGAQLTFGPNGEVGFPTIFRPQPVLINYGPDTSRTRIHYPRTNVYSFEGITSSAA